MWSREWKRNLSLKFLGYKFSVKSVDILEIDSKELTKKLSKKFACSCSATDSNSVQIQGDFYEDVR